MALISKARGGGCGGYGCGGCGGGGGGGGQAKVPFLFPPTSGNATAPPLLSSNREREKKTGPSLSHSLPSSSSSSSSSSKRERGNGTATEVVAFLAKVAKLGPSLPFPCNFPPPPWLLYSPPPLSNFLLLAWTLQGPFFGEEGREGCATSKNRIGEWRVQEGNLPPPPLFWPFLLGHKGGGRKKKFNPCHSSLSFPPPSATSDPVAKDTCKVCRLTSLLLLILILHLPQKKKGRGGERVREEPSNFQDPPFPSLPFLP